MIEAATMAEAHHFIINDLEEGYATRTGFQGSRLSGGQRQRLALTRAFLKEPKLIILDEATSALDPITHTKIQNALRKYLKERSVTCIIIAHHVESLKLADRVILLGKRETTDSVTEILEMGSHEDLMRRRGKYYTLFTSNNQLE